MSTARAPGPSEVRLPFRLRTPLALGLIGWLLSAAVPRARAAFDLQGAAADHANYAACMAGPLGPGLLKARSPGYEELIRRRLVSSEPDGRPFAGCASVAERIGVATPALSAQASTFPEYFGQDAAGRPSRRAPEGLRHDLGRLDELAARAFPFAPAHYEELVLPQRHIREAPHPGEAARPARGRGLSAAGRGLRLSVALGDYVIVAEGSGANRRALVSQDRGLHFHAGGASALASLRSYLEGSPQLSAVVTETGEWVVMSVSEGHSPHVARLAPSGSQLISVDADESGLAALLIEGGGSNRLVLRNCALRGPCIDVTVPPIGKRPLALPADVARVGTDLVLVMRTGSVSRVTTSRDGGASFGPWAMVWEDAEGADGEHALHMDRLVHLGDDLLLIGSPEDASSGYGVLLSTDHGASFRPHPGGETGADLASGR